MTVANVHVRAPCESSYLLGREGPYLTQRGHMNQKQAEPKFSQVLIRKAEVAP
jgi:hypothetical protein